MHGDQDGQSDDWLIRS